MTANTQTKDKICSSPCPIKLCLPDYGFLMLIYGRENLIAIRNFPQFLDHIDVLGKAKHVTDHYNYLKYKALFIYYAFVHSLHCCYSSYFEDSNSFDFAYDFFVEEVWNLSSSLRLKKKKIHPLGDLNIKLTITYKSKLTTFA